MNEERIGYSSGWTVEEDPEGGFRWAAHGPGGILHGQAVTRAAAERAAQEAERELAAGPGAAGTPQVRLGPQPARIEAWGPLTERRLLLEDGLEVEVGIAEPAWAATDPVDPGTRRVVTDGLRILHDPDGRLAALAIAASAGQP